MCQKITTHLHKPASLNVYRQTFSVRHLQLFFFTAVLTILCTRSPFDMLLTVIIFTIQKSDLLCDKGCDPVYVKRCLLRSAQPRMKRGAVCLLGSRRAQNHNLPSDSLMKKY